MMKLSFKSIGISGALLAIFAIAGTTLVTFTHQQTKDQIAANERQALLDKLAVLVPPATIDNNMLEDQVQVHRADLLGAQSTTVYRARKEGKPVAVVLNPVVPDGYAGPINLLVAVNHDGSLGGVRVISHKETPGLGDKVEETRSDWVLSFNGKSLTDPTEDKWGVRRDGGYFDQFTGATITPRSIVKAVKKTLVYVREQGDRLYESKAERKVSKAPKAEGETK
jgi:electron transport complex protein RnfG